MGWSRRSGLVGGLAALLMASTMSFGPGGATAHEIDNPRQTEPATDARIEGRVVDGDGRPIAGVKVQTVSTYGIPVGMEAVTHTRENGTYSLRKLGPATYRILFDNDDSNTPAVKEYWPNALEYARAADIVITESQVVRGIDAVLTRAARIRGVFGDGVDDQQEYVHAYRWTEESWQPFRGEHQDVPPGTYEVSGLPAGRYRVMADAGHSVQGPDTGPTITVKAGQTVAGPHIQFQDGGAVSGTVTLPGEQTWDVTLYQRHDGRWKASNDSPFAHEDFFEFWDIRPGTYRLGVEAAGHRPEFWPNSDDIETAQDIVVAPGSEVENIDSTLGPLPPGVSVSGRLLYPNGSPVIGASAGLYRQAVDGSWEHVAGAQTNGEGRYALDELQPGTYRLEFSGSSQEMIGATFWGGTRELETGRDIVIPRPAEDVSIPDSVVEPGGVIAGQIEGALDGERLQIGIVTAYRRVGGAWSLAARGYPNWDGEYYIYGLPAGTYLIGVHDELQEYAPEFFPEAHKVANAEPITLQPQEQRTLDFTVEFGVRNLARPRLSGRAQVDRTLRLRSGTWSPYRLRLEHRWLANGKPIRGAHGATYRVRARDVGKRISVRFTGAYPGYIPWTVATAPSNRVRR